MDTMQIILLVACVVVVGAIVATSMHIGRSTKRQIELPSRDSHPGVPLSRAVAISNERRRNRRAVAGGLSGRESRS